MTKPKKGGTWHEGHGSEWTAFFRLLSYKHKCRTAGVPQPDLQLVMACLIWNWKTHCDQWTLVLNQTKSVYILTIFSKLYFNILVRPSPPTGPCLHDVFQLQCTYFSFLCVLDDPPTSAFFMSLCSFVSVARIFHTHIACRGLFLSYCKPASWCTLTQHDLQH